MPNILTRLALLPAMLMAAAICSLLFSIPPKKEIALWEYFLLAGGIFTFLLGFFQFVVWALVSEGAHADKAVVDIPDAWLIIPMPSYHSRRFSLLQIPGWVEKPFSFSNAVRWCRMALTMVGRALVDLLARVYHRFV